MINCCRPPPALREKNTNAVRHNILNNGRDSGSIKERMNQPYVPKKPGRLPRNFMKLDFLATLLFTAALLLSACGNVSQTTPIVEVTQGATPRTQPIDLQSGYGM